MTNSQSTTTAPKSTFDAADWSRLQALVKSEMSGVVYDASRKRPLYSKSTEEAVAKRDAITKAFAEFLTMVEGIKKKG